jgi:integrase
VANKKRANQEGSIRLRADGRWEALYSTPGGKRKSIYGKTQAEVRVKLNKISHSIGNGCYIENKNITFGSWLDEWLMTYAKPNIRTSTYASYETYIRGHIKPVLGKIKIQNLKPDMLQKFLNGKQNAGRLDNSKGGLSTKTIRNLYNMIHASLQQAYKNGIVYKNIADLITLPKIIKNEIQVFSVQEQKRLENKCKEYRLGVGVILTLYTGIRLGELLGLMWSDIDIKNKSMTIRRTLNRLTVHDDPTKKTAIVIGEPKSAKGQRDIPLQGFLIPMLMNFKRRQREERLLPRQSCLNDNYVICNEQGKYIEPRTYQDFFKRMLKEAGITFTNFHVLRHSFSTRAIEHNFDIKVLSDILGHADASTTLNKYGHALPDHKKQSMDKLKLLWSTKV